MEACSCCGWRWELHSAQKLCPQGVEASWICHERGLYAHVSRSPTFWVLGVGGGHRDERERSMERLRPDSPCDRAL